MQVVSEDMDDDSHMCLRCHTIIQGLDAYVCHRKEHCRGLRPSQTRAVPLMVSFHQDARRSSPAPAATVACPSTSTANISNDPLLAVTSTSQHDKHESDKLLSDLVGPVMSADEFMSHLGLSIVTPSAWSTTDLHPDADDFFSSLELQSITKPRASDAVLSLHQLPTAASRAQLETPITSPQKKDCNSVSQHQDHRDHEWDQLSTPHKRLLDPASGPDEIPTLVEGVEEVTTAAEMSDLAAEAQFPSPYTYRSLSKLFAGDAEGGELDDALASPSGSSPPIWPTIPVQSAPSIFPSRGKWMPGNMNKGDIRKSGSRVQYFCESCNRRLSSRLLYERHLQSDYHAKRLSSLASTSPSSCAPADAEGVAPATTTRSVEAMYSLRSQRRRLDCSDDEVDSLDGEAGGSRKSSSFSSPFLYLPSSSRSSHRTGGTTSTASSTRGSAASGDQCATCRAWIPRGLLGKHLISRYHVTRSKYHSRYQPLILQHIHLIVREALYQCRLCKFYCHSRPSFLQHWASASHEQEDGVTDGDSLALAYYCGLCRAICSSSDLMGQHLQSAVHRTAEDIVSKAVPIILQRITLVSCPVTACGRKFRLHFQVNRHLATCHGRQLAEGIFSGSGECEKLKCEHCNFETTSRATFTHHVHHRHAEDHADRYRCLLCRLKFATKAAAVQHRSSQEHRDSARKTKWGEQRTRKCSHCYQVLVGMAALRQHMEQLHPTLLPRCFSCGLTFAVKQQLSAHRRGGCKGASDASSSTPPTGLPCPNCPFTTHLLTDLLFHRGIEHSDLLKDRVTVPAGKVACPECHRCYTQAALKKHVAVHTSERPHQCRICGRRFAIQFDLQAHREHLHHAH